MKRTRVLAACLLAVAWPVAQAQDGGFAPPVPPGPGRTGRYTAAVDAFLASLGM